MTENDSFFNRLLAVPILALFLGVGVLCAGVVIVLIRDQALASSVVLVVTGAASLGCGGGLVILSVLLGLAAYRRLLSPPTRPPAAHPSDPWQLPADDYPPALSAPVEGSWTSAGFPAYDLADHD